MGIADIKTRTKNKYGQYFTPRHVAEFMVGLADLHARSEILEPCAGEGVFIQCLMERGFKNITAYEIDPGLAREGVICESFVSANITQKFDLVIGNPPYIRWMFLENELRDELRTSALWQKHCNTLSDYMYIFLLKSVELLNENGQLIFICPEYWFNTTGSISVRNFLIRQGGFESVYRFIETPIFPGVAVSTIIFKYIKSKKPPRKLKLITYNGRRRLDAAALNNIQNPSFSSADIVRDFIPQFKSGENWLLTPVSAMSIKLEKECADPGFSISLFDKGYAKIGDVCDIANGMVSGLDSAFHYEIQELDRRNENEIKASVKVVKAKHLNPYLYEKTSEYIFLPDGLTEEDLKNHYSRYYYHLIDKKPKLVNRYNYGKDLKYWEWAFPRSYKRFASDADRIFVPCKERISNKDYFRFAFAPQGVYATQDVTALFKKEGVRESIFYILALLNHPLVYSWIKINGVIKGNIVEFSEGPISKIPFRRIDWSNKNEVLLHDDIVRSVMHCVHENNRKWIPSIQKCVNKLLNVEAS